MPNYTVKIAIIGVSKCGKTRIANYLADMNYKLPEELQPTKALRVLEFDINDVKVKSQRATVDVQLWDTSGNDEYSSFWRVFRANVDGVVFVHSNDENSSRKLDTLYNFYINPKHLSPRTCLACILSPTSKFSKIAQINVDLEKDGEKFKQEFQKFVLSILNNDNEEQQQQ